MRSDLEYLLYWKGNLGTDIIQCASGDKSWHPHSKIHAISYYHCFLPRNTSESSILTHNQFYRIQETAYGENQTETMNVKQPGLGSVTISPALLFWW